MSALESLVKLSGSVSQAPALTQGGGGNTSVKQGNEMLVKASGFRLDEVSNTKGFVIVNYKPVQTFLQKKTDDLNNPDAELKQFVNEQIIGDKTYLPSMETGFHAVLNKYVIHTHPVVVNQLMCSKDGEARIKETLKNTPHIVLPFLNPGYFLSKAIADIKNIPSVIFLKNHGLIVHGESEQVTIQAHQNVIAELSAALNFKSDSNFELIQVSEQVYELKAQWLSHYFNQDNLLASTWFPDQAVVIGNEYQYTENHAIDKKLNFIKAGKQCLINTGYKNALAITENLCALANIWDYNNQNQIPLNAIPHEDVAYILGMDMEKYRQGLLK